MLLFPESFIPGYPRGFTFGATIGKRTDAGRELYAEYVRNSIELDGPEVARLTQLAREENVYLVIGVTEQQSGTGTLYCSMLYCSADRRLRAWPCMYLSVLQYS